jgi:hypothetical protein
MAVMGQEKKAAQHMQNNKLWECWRERHNHVIGIIIRHQRVQLQVMIF